MNTTNSSTANSSSTPRRWRIARRLLVTAAAVTTLIAVFYTVENWRGKRAWENSRRELEAKGEVIDWTKCIPAQVPDDQNIFKAPHMQEWFVRPSPTTPQSTTPSPFALSPRNEVKLMVAEVTIVAPNAAPASQPADATFRFDDPAAREQVATLLRDAIGPCALGSKAYVLLAHPLDQFKPLHLTLQAGTAPDAKALAAFFSASLTNLTMDYSDTSIFRVDSAGSNTFRVSLRDQACGAAEYLEWTDSTTSDFDVLRKALERPFARIDCDYTQPFLMLIPNFVTVRNAAQILSQRTQCHLLLGQPEEAWHELSLVHDLCRVLLSQPTGKPMTLVAAMINTAVHGLYPNVVEDGLRLHAWREPQLVAIEQQLKATDLLAPVLEGFKEERAASCYTFETIKTSELLKLMKVGTDKSPWQEVSLRLVLTLMPRGWYYQNMVVGAQAEQELLDCVDLGKQRVTPHQTEIYLRYLQLHGEKRSPYTFLVAWSLPNFVKALQTTAHNQTVVNEASLACALERQHLAKGDYPETLDALTPQFIEKLPHDLISGQPLKYHRTAGGGYQLYSIGWDEKDNGGTVGKSKEEGDWVWEQRQ
ncbi:MAG: hypothetical protein JWM68_198 [Verrucomicrobiales bacterium]|nr:hypothetical protein [Verrucomicrobiales bacterium]